MPVDDAFAQRRVFQAERGDGQNGDPVLVDQERILVGAVRGAAIFDDPQAPGRQIVDDAMIEQDHAVGDIFLDAVARQAALAALGRDHGGELRDP